MKNTIEKRKQSRVNLSGYIADIADGNFVYTGTVQDVSTKGLRLNDLPNKFTFNGKAVKIVVSHEFSSTHYKLQAYPQWRIINGISLDVGFNIINAPASWNTLIQQSIPTKENKNHEGDIWDQYIGAKV